MTREATGASPGFDTRMVQRHRRSRIGRWIFLASTIAGVVVLSALIFNVIDQAFGLVAIEATIDPASLAVDGLPLEELSREELTAILQTYVSEGLFRKLENDQPFTERTRGEVYELVIDSVVEPTIVDTWPLTESVFRRDEIEATVAAEHAGAELVFRSWVTPAFIGGAQSSNPLIAGIRPAVLGSLWIIGIAVLLALPIGIGAAVYLEEYARDSWLNRIIQININNLAGVPSIIYGMLGLAIFVRGLEPLTSGTLLGLAADSTTANGRTVMAAGLTLALLVLPLVIISAQEAIRSVPASLRQAAYGLGGTKWQTIWHHVLPNAVAGILTGTILAVSRAMGETAPLVVVGAATFITSDPTSLFSKFTALPIQIYQWTSRPQDEFRNLAAGAILVLLVLLLSLNAAAILLRNRYGRQGRHL